MTNTHQPSTIGRLRASLPTRAVQPWEAHRVAETQASQLRRSLAPDDLRFDTDLIATLPRIRIVYRPHLAASGSSQWRRGSWHIAVNPIEAEVRQRFTICHELKHIIDAPRSARMFRDIAERVDGDRQIEAVCDHFAACLLMPKRLVKRVWGEGMRDLSQLALTFDVSTTAMRRRLEDLGLVDRRTRHHHPHPSWYLEPAPMKEAA